MSMSTNTGTNPNCTIGKYVVDQLTAGTMTSLPSFISCFRIKACRPTRFAELPEFVMIALRDPILSANSFSKLAT